MGMVPKKGLLPVRALDRCLPNSLRRQICLAWYVLFLAIRILRHNIGLVSPERDFEEDKEEQTEAAASGSGKKEEKPVIPDSTLPTEIQVI